MQFINRFTVFTKRILAHKMYLIMLASLVLLTTVYKLLPSKEQSTDIKAAIYCEDDSEYFNALYTELTGSNSIYTFYLADSKEALLNDVKSSYAECGFVIPDGFFTNFIEGTTDQNPIQMYKTPSSALSFSICETMFSKTYTVIAEELMLYCTELDAYNDELTAQYNYYVSSDEIFQLMDVTDHVFDFETIIYRINIPVFEITILLVLFSGLLGLLLYQQDKEKKLYLALNKKALFEIQSLSTGTSIMPILLVGMICNILLYGFAKQMLLLLIAALCVFVLSLFLGVIIRKSTLLEKVLPLIMLISIIGVFFKTTL